VISAITLEFSEPESASANSAESMSFLSVMAFGCGPQGRRSVPTNAFAVRLLSDRRQPFLNRATSSRIQGE
jgi:hypothetical protein